MSLPEDIKQSIAQINNLNTRKAAGIIALYPAAADIVVTRSVDGEDYFVDINGKDAVMLPVLILELVCEAHNIVVPISRSIIDVVDAIAEAKYIPPKPQQHYLPPTAAAPTSRVGTTLELNMNDEASQLFGFGSQLEDGQSQYNDETQQHDDPVFAADMGRLLQRDDNLQSQSPNSESLPSKPPPPSALPSKPPPPQPPTQNQPTLPLQETTTKPDKPQRMFMMGKLYTGNGDKDYIMKESGGQPSSSHTTPYPNKNNTITQQTTVGKQTTLGAFDSTSPASTMSSADDIAHQSSSGSKPFTNEAIASGTSSTQSARAETVGNVSKIAVVPKISLLDRLKEYSESNPGEKKISSTKVKDEFKPISKLARAKTVNLMAQEIHGALVKLCNIMENRRSGKDEAGKVVTNVVTYCLKNLKNGNELLLTSKQLDAYTMVIVEMIELIMTGTLVGHRELWYIVETYFISAVYDMYPSDLDDEELQCDEDELDDEDYQDLQEFEIEETQNLDDSSRKVKQLAYKWFINAVNDICTLTGYTTMHLNIKKGARAYAYGDFVLVRKSEELILPVFDSDKGVWTTTKYIRPEKTIDFSQDGGVPLSWNLAKDGLGIDSVDIHFCPPPSSKVNLVQLFEADGPCGWYINSGCAAENGVVCVNTRGTLTFYASYFCVYAEDSLQTINLFQNDFNVYGVSIAAAVNGSFVDWEKVNEKAVYSVLGKSINLPEYQLLRKVNYFMLFGPDDIETLFKKYPDIKAKNSKWTTKHSTMIKGLRDRKKNNFCSKGMAHWNSKMSQRRDDFLAKFEEMELNLQLESLGSDGKLVVGIMNERHKIIVGKKEGYEEKMY